MKRFAAVFAFVALVAGTASLARAIPVEATVVGADGAPVAGAWVIDSEMREPLTTDKNGRFSIDWKAVPAGDEYFGIVTVYAPGHALTLQPMKRRDNILRLDPATTVQGVVRDGGGRPIADLPLQLLYVESRLQDTSRVIIPVPAAFREKLSTRTAADGSWSLSGMPARGTAFVQWEDPRFVREAVSVPIGEAGKVVVARPAATITGRVRYEDGRPASDVKVAAQGQGNVNGWAEASTGEDGAYRLGGLPSGSFNIVAMAKASEWVAVAVEGAAQEGATTAAPDLVLQKGSLIEGTVTDDATGKPLEGVSIGNQGPHFPRSGAMIMSATTDAAGKFRLRVAPGANLVYITGAPVGYLRDAAVGVELTVGPSETKTLPFRLSRGLIVTGNAVDETGKPVAGVKLEFVKGFEAKETFTDEKGGWTIGGLAPGESTLSVAAAEWELVSPRKMTFPAQAPVRVTLRRVEVADLSGRVVTATGEPLPGATVKAEVLVPMGEGQWKADPQELTSDGRGRFALGKVRPDARVRLVVSKDGFRYISGGVMSGQGALRSLSETIMAALTARVSGTLRDGAGKPVGGVQVLSPEGGGTRASTITDAAGKFELADLPEGEVRIVAANKAGFASARVRTGIGPVVLSLLPHAAPPAGSDKERAYAILDDLWSTSKEAGYYARDNVPMEIALEDPDRALKMVAGRDGRVPDWVRLQLLWAVADSDPVRAAQWGPGQLALIGAEDTRRDAAARLGARVALVRRDLALALYRQASQKPPSGEGMRLAFSCINLFTLAARLQLPEASTWLDKAVEAVKAMQNPTGVMEALAESVAEGDPAQAERMAAALPPHERAGALSRAIPTVALNSPATAQAMLARLKSIPGEDHYYGIAAKAVIEALGKQDAAAALAVARGVTDRSHRAIALAMAASHLPAAEAVPVFKEAMQAAAEGYEAVAAMSRIAAMAWDKDPALGRELFVQAREKMDKNRSESDDEDDRRGVDYFAFYYARVDPGEARLLLEAEFARRKPMAIGDEARRLVRPALAMSAVDIERALEMAREIPGAGRFDAQRKIAQYVLASPEVRRMLPFDRWGASDTWRPGTPTNW